MFQDASSWLYKGDHTAPSVMEGTEKSTELHSLLKAMLELRAEHCGRPGGPLTAWRIGGSFPEAECWSII